MVWVLGQGLGVFVLGDGIVMVMFGPPFGEVSGKLCSVIGARGAPGWVSGNHPLGGLRGSGATGDISQTSEVRFVQPLARISATMLA